MFDRVRRTLLSVLLVSVTACGSLPERSAIIPDGWNETLAQKNQIMSWKLQGRLGVQTEAQGGAMDLFWLQHDDAYNIRLIAPLGQGAILLQGDAGGVNIKTADGESRYANNPDELFATTLGVQLPVNGLRDWLRGIPMRGLPIERQDWDENGNLYKLIQDGWRIEMSKYRKVNNQMLPHAFYLERDDRPELEIRLLIRNWQLDPV